MLVAERKKTTARPGSVHCKTGGKAGVADDIGNSMPEKGFAGTTKSSPLAA